MYFRIVLCWLLSYICYINAINHITLSHDLSSRASYPIDQFTFGSTHGSLYMNDSDLRADRDKQNSQDRKRYVATSGNTRDQSDLNYGELCKYTGVFINQDSSFS